MAPDDMASIIYKVLAYAQECLKQGGKPDIDTARELAGSPTNAWWCATVASMIDEGLVRGVKVDSYISGAKEVVATDFEVTLKGTRYLSNDDAMKEAKKLAGQAFLNALSTAVVSSLPSMLKI